MAAERLRNRHVDRRYGTQRHAVVHALLGWRLLRDDPEGGRGVHVHNEPSLATRSTTNTDVTVDDDATVSWKVVFDSSSDLVADSEHCEKTTLHITN